MCENRRVLGVSCDDYHQNGAHAEYVSVPQHILYRLPESVSFEQAAMVEPCSVAFHAIERTPLSINDTVVVVGAGMIGLLVIQTLRATCCGQIIAVDIEPEKLEHARHLGADIGLNANQTDVTSEINRLTQNRGADVAFEVVGVSAALKMALDSIRKGGALTLIGNISPNADLGLQSVVTREITLYGSCASQGEYPACLDMIARGAINVDRLMSAIVPLSDGGRWFQRLYDNEKGLLKVILVP